MNRRYFRLCFDIPFDVRCSPSQFCILPGDGRWEASPSRPALCKPSVNRRCRYPEYGSDFGDEYDFRFHIQAFAAFAVRSCVCQYGAYLIRFDTDSPKTGQNRTSGNGGGVGVLFYGVMSDFVGWRNRTKPDIAIIVWLVR